MSGKEFLDNCTAHGGNWSSMIMSGIRKCFPEQYNSMPDDKEYDFFELMQIAADCGVVWED
jgi:hypothetical protein